MNLNGVTLEELRLWSSDALKHFLSIRKKSVEGTFDELVARAFTAHEDKTPVDVEAEKAERRLFTEYTIKLRHDGQVFPDPATFEDGWLSEEGGMVQWPNVYITDIAEYLKQTSANKNDLVGKLLNEYKDGKAYRYYACEWVKEVKYHPVRTSSPLAFLKAQVHPSMAIRKKPWSVWVLVEKKTPKTPGGKIRASYCTCPAGLLGSCNHIAALLFRVEAAVRMGANEQACTEGLCGWVVPKNGISRKPGKWRDTYVVKDKYTQKQSSDHKKAALQQRRDFMPFGVGEADRLLDSEKISEELKNLFINDASDSVFILMKEKRKASAPHKPVLPDPPTVCAEQCKTAAEIEKAMTLDKSAADILEVHTRNQSQSTDWHEQRAGRITSSSFYSVHTKSEKLQIEDGQTDVSEWLMHKVMGTNTTMTAAMKHGISMEAKAKASYCEAQRKQHAGWTCRDSGLVVSTEHSFLATSPDLVVTCQCHGKRLCEIKCPYAIRGQAPSAENVPYLRNKDGKITLAKKHQYYGQIQGQLALMGCTVCDLFIYTAHGSLTVEVTFDSEFWNVMLHNLSWFWKNKIAPELLKLANSRSAKKRRSEVDDGAQVIPQKQPCASSCTLLPPDTEYEDGSACSTPAAARLVVGKMKRKKTQPVVLRVYQCGVCGDSVDEEPQTFDQISVKCDQCPQWYHQICVGIVEGSEIADDDEWVCEQCAK